MTKMKSFTKCQPPSIGGIEINVEKFHVLKMLEATFTKGGFIFIHNSKFTAALINEALCVEYPKNDLAVVGTQKLVDLMPSFERCIYGDQND